MAHKVATTDFYAPAGDGTERLVRAGHVVAEDDPILEGRGSLFVDADDAAVVPTRPVFVAEPQDPTVHDDSVLFVGDDEDDDGPVDVDDPADAPAAPRGRRRS